MAIQRTLGLSILLLFGASFCLAASNAELYFASDKNGANRVTNVQEGSSVWIVAYDPDENIDCDVRDKIWTDVKLMDPKTGAYLVWVSYLSAAGDGHGAEYTSEDYVPYKGHYPGNSAGWLGADYLEETDADTSVFVSQRAFRIGAREDYSEPRKNTHVVCNSWHPLAGDQGWLSDFSFGNYINTGNDFCFVGERLVFDFNPRESGFSGQDWERIDDVRFPDAAVRMLGNLGNYLIGRFENMDTLVGMYQDPDDETDVATAMMKIIDTEATITWDEEIYKDANGAATITVTDPDENLNCSKIEYVPVFIIVNPGSWNPVDGEPWDGEGGKSPTNFCMLKRTGGVDGTSGGFCFGIEDRAAIRWYNAYQSQANAFGRNGTEDGRYYMQYATEHSSPWNVVWFDTVNEDGLTAVSFFAQETGANTGCFQVNLNSILADLGFNSLEVRDVLTAYYLDPNDEDDFKLDVAYIEEKNHSITSFTDASRQDKELYWIGRDPVYVQVIDANANVDPCCSEQVVVLICDPHGEDDAEWVILDETSSNSPVFFLNWGLELLPVWDGVGGFVRPGHIRGCQLVLDNWKFEAFNEDDVFAQYNDAYYGAPAIEGFAIDNDIRDGLAALGDSDTDTSFPPLITHGSVANVTTGLSLPRAIGGSPGARVPNDVSFDVVSIADTQVYDGQSTQMWFLDRQGNRISGYVSSDCVFVEVVDADQNEDVFRRERVDAFWDAGQGGPIGPESLNAWECGVERRYVHPWNRLFGDTNIFNDGPDADGWYYDLRSETTETTRDAGWGKIYVANPRNGRWAGLDLLETGISTGDFVSVICVDLVNVYTCVPTLGALPGDTIVAFYQDPSNHSDSAMISTKVGIGGGATPGQASSTTFIDRDGNVLSLCQPGQEIRVRVTDLSHTQDVSLPGAVVVDGVAYDLTTFGSQSHMFVTEPIAGDLQAGEMITATYIDPADPTDTSSASIPVAAAKLSVERFYAGPNPSAGDVTFGYKGSGIATVMSVAVYDLAGHVVWASEMANVTKIVWSLAAGARPAANGCYIYQVTATDGTDTFNGKGTLFINR